MQPANSLRHVEDQKDQETAEDHAQNQTRRRMKQVVQPGHVSDVHVRLVSDEIEQGAADQRRRQNNSNHGQGEIDDTQWKPKEQIKEGRPGTYIGQSLTY